MISYGEFAYVYDRLMENVDYQLWIDFFKEKVNQYSEIEVNRILDLACGTGELSIRFASAGYEVVGVDLSDDMLAVASAKARMEKKSISFFNQDMTEIEGLQTFDSIVIFCDSLNYLENEDKVKKTFANVYNILHKGGLFIFDVHSLYKMNEIFMDQVFVNDDEDVSYIWNCYQGPYENSVEHDLSFFVKNQQNDHYQRFDEQHLQRSFSTEEYEQWLKQAGFTVIDISADYGKQISKDSERIFFTVKK